MREGLEEQEEGVVRRWWQVEGQDDRYELLDEYDVRWGVVWCCVKRMTDGLCGRWIGGRAWQHRGASEGWRGSEEARKDRGWLKIS